MSCMFGEVVFPSSRAFWDEDNFESFDTDNESAKEFKIEWTDSAPTSIEQFIVIESELLIDFANSCLVKGSKKVCTIRNSKTKKEPSIIYQVKDGIYICVVGAEVDLPQSANFVEKIQEIVKLSKQVMVVTCNHVSHFKGTQPDSPSFLRSLCTKNCEKVFKNKAPILSQPNIVSGVSAGVIAVAEILDIPAIMYVLYTDTFALDITAVTPLKELFSSTLNVVLPEYTSSTRGFFSKENLYM